MRTHLLLPLLLPFALACGKACSPGAPSVDAGLWVRSPSPPTPPPMTRPSAEAARAFAGRYLVILSSEEELNPLPAVVEKLRAEKDLPLELLHLSSSDFAGLRPCYQLLVAQAFERKADAVAYAKRLGALSVQSYVKNAGDFAGEGPARVAACQARGELGPSGGVPRFVEVWGGRVFLQLQDAPPEVTVRPLDDTRRVWLGRLAQSPSDDVAVGTRFAVYSGPRSVTCAVTGFYALVRGQPHFGYFQQEPRPETPGCGGPAAFAELDCRISDPDGALALPAKARAPLFYTPVESGPEARRAEKLLRASEAFQSAVEEARGEASKDKPLGVKVTTKAFRGAAGTLVQVTGHVITGEGADSCGGDEFNRSVSAAVFYPTKGPAREVLAVSEAEKGDELLHVLDLEGDGKVELLFRNGALGPRTWLLSGSEELNSLEVEYCDCAC